MFTLRGFIVALGAFAVLGILGMVFMLWPEAAGIGFVVIVVGMFFVFTWSMASATFDDWQEP